MTAYQPNERICSICGNPYRIYGRIMCQECDEQVDWVGTPPVEEWPPAPPTRRRAHDHSVRP